MKLYFEILRLVILSQNNTNPFYQMIANVEV